MSKTYVPEKFRTYVSNSKTYIQRTPQNIEKMAYGLMRYLVDRELFDDVRIYFKKGKSWHALQGYKPERGNIPFQEIIHNHGNREYKAYLLSDIDPNDYFEYNGDYLSMSFEGPLYHIINGTEYLHVHQYVCEHLRNYFSHWGLYYEQGHAWNLSLYEE